MKAFLCHTSQNSAFVIEVAKHLRRNLDDVFYYEDHQRNDLSFVHTITQELNECQVMVIFVGKSFTRWQLEEAETAYQKHIDGAPRSFFIILLPDAEGKHAEFPETISMLMRFPKIQPGASDSRGAFEVASEVVNRLEIPWRSPDDLPLNPHLFSYEKDIIDFFNSRNLLGDRIFDVPSSAAEANEFGHIREKVLNGCPSAWPRVVKWTRKSKTLNPLDPDEVGNWRPEQASVLTAALSNGSKGTAGDAERRRGERLVFLEAGPRESLYFPKSKDTIKVAILVSGGIAPGINAVIDGIVQRHWLYAEKQGYRRGLKIYGLQNGFRAFDNLDDSIYYLAADPSHYAGEPKRLETSNHVNEGGSILGTSRADDLIDAEQRIEALKHIDHHLLNREIDILYVIGGDGSMKAAHAIWSIAQENPDRKAEPSKGREERPLSVVAIPKTMDNDILWVWQSFGFLSAVEKAREIIEHLSTEVTSNPRLCVVQLFGSDSGFVVSHAVLASATGHCSLALIPEITFSMKGIASYLKKKMCDERQRIPFALVVMSETAIPTDAMNYVGDPDAEEAIDIGLSEEEKTEIRKFHEMRLQNKRIQGQTNDALRTAGLKIVSRGLQELLPKTKIPPSTGFQPDWEKLRGFTNEPRHLLRAIPPSCSDIIIGHRLGTLAVDNAMAGYTDCMISQWLTEYVLVPLKLVVLGRKRIPTSGIFWKSVLTKSGQPANLE